MASLNEIDELQASIGRTNNGYLFAPLGSEIRIAREHPEFFKMENVGGEFPIRIYDTGARRWEVTLFQSAPAGSQMLRGDSCKFEVAEKTQAMAIAKVRAAHPELQSFPNAEAVRL